jgi:hypothetical protein
MYAVAMDLVEWWAGLTAYHTNNYPEMFNISY